MKKLFQLSVVLFFSFGIWFVCEYFLASEKKIGFIDLNKVYSNFEMKRELESKLKLVQQKRKMTLDSLKFELNTLARQIDRDAGNDVTKLTVFESKRQDYLEKERRFNDENVNNAKLFDEQIFLQLNQYVKDFGETNGFTFIFGAEGSGALMYAEEKLDVTSEVQTYINGRYKGKIRE